MENDIDLSEFCQIILIINLKKWLLGWLIQLN
jgi:hypothetical protein